VAASSNTPIQYEVGEAILEYLRNERPRCVWHVFVTMQLPYRPVGPGGLWGIIGKRMKRINYDCASRVISGTLVMNGCGDDDDAETCY
jgi:hypothetical protein